MIQSLAVISLFTFAAQNPQTTATPTAHPTNHWPQFRGPAASGIADDRPLPTKWNAEKNENILWKTPIPGLGHSSPCVWDDRVYLTTAIRAGGDAELKVGLYGNAEAHQDDASYEWKVLCLDLHTGKILWERTANQGVPRVKRHLKSTHANCTPATDGQHVVAFFGSEGLYCYDAQGDLKWKKDFGTLDAGFYRFPKMQWEFASSPVIHDGRVIVQCDVQKNSFLAAFDVKTGNEIWRTARDELPTWGTPTVVTHDGCKMILVNGHKHAGAYDFNDGSEIWKVSNGGDIPVPAVIAAHDLAFITNAHGQLAPMYAVKLGSKGDVSLKDDETTSKGIVWCEMRGGAYMQTPIVVGDYLYSCRDNGVLSCWTATTGERHYRERLGEGTTGFTASPVAGDGKLYFTSEEGDIFVLKPGPKFEQLANNPMGEVCMATPAIAQGLLLFRTQKHLVAVGKMWYDAATVKQDEAIKKPYGPGEKLPNPPEKKP